MSRRLFPTSCVAVHICIIRPVPAISNRLVLGYVPSYNFLCLHMWVLAEGLCRAGLGGDSDDLQCGCAVFDTRQDYFVFDSECRLTLGPTSLVYEVATEGNFCRRSAAEARNCLLIQAYCMNLTLPRLLDVTLCLVIKHNLCFLFSKDKH
jgi:hypothetical protein